MIKFRNLNYYSKFPAVSQGLNFPEAVSASKKAPDRPGLSVLFLLRLPGSPKLSLFLQGLGPIAVKLLQQLLLVLLPAEKLPQGIVCLLYTSDAADEL